MILSCCLTYQYFDFTEVEKRKILSLKPQDRFFDLILL